MNPTDTAWVHPSALIESGAQLGPGTKVWDNVHIRRQAVIGQQCIIGEKTYVAYEVTIGDFVKLNASVYICAGVTIEDFCMIAAHTVFTNDRFPRAGNLELTGPETSDITEQTERTRVCRGTTIGANATVGPGLTLGPFAMVGMGAVVTRDVPPHGLVVGNPARLVGWVCVCGQQLPVHRPDGPTVAGADAADGAITCARCGRGYHLSETGLRLIHDR